MTVLSIGQMWADTEAVLNSVGTKEVTSATVSSVSKVFDGVTCLIERHSSNAPGFYTGSGIVRYYGSDVMTLSVESGNTITQIDFSYYSGTSSAGTADPTGLSGSQWTGSAQSVSFTGTTTTKISSITVTYSSGGSTKTLSSVAVSGTPDKTEYYAGQDFDPAGLTVTGTYSDASQQTFTSGITWTYNPSQTLALNQTSIGVTATVSEIASEEFEVSGLTVTEAPAAASYEKVTAAPSDWSGEYLIVYENGATAYVWTGVDAVSCYATATISNDVIAQPEGTSSVTIASMEGGYSILVNGGTNDGKYIQNNGTSNGIKFVNAGVATTLTYENNAVTITCGGKMFRYNNTSGNYRFRYFGSAQQVIQLYKKVDGTAKPSAGLAFDAAQKLAKVGGTLAAPNLSTADGFDGTVTYASSDEAVVKVNASTGAITEIVAAGKAVITAHSDETENFKEGSASYTIFVATEAGTAEDPLTEASAKALIDLGCEMEVHVHGTVLGSQDATKFTVTLAGGMQFYKLKDLGNVAFESAYIKNGDEVTAVGTLTKYNTTYELAEGCYLTAYTEYTEPLVDISNTKETAYTVAQALALATNPTSDLTKAVYIAGVVYDVKSFNSTNGTLDIYIKDEGVENKFEFYKCAGIYDESLTEFAAADDVQVGDEVIGYGVMKYFSGGSIWEFDNTATGDYLVELTRPAVAVTGVTVESTASVAVGGHVTLHAAVVPENASNKTINWSIESGNAYVTLVDGVVTGVAEGTAVIRATSDADATKYAECTVTVAPLSPWASVYTSNVTLSTEGGTSASAAKVKFYGEEGDGYDAIKAGTGSAQGAVVVNVPAGATALHFHAYGWTSESVGLTVTAPAGVTVSPATEISINSNSGITSNSPFTLAEGSDPKTEAYYAVSLSGNTEATNITISATSGKRFVLFGVNQEGGLVLESISITGTATALEYTDGQHFDPTGLSVTGHYSDASTAPITEGIVWAFDPDPLTEGTTSVSVTATAAGFTSAAFVVDGLTVAGAAPLSPWATTWTSNLDDITGSKVKFYGEETEYAALKAGSSGTAGSATLNIPAQATELHLHAYGWNSEDVTLSITAPAGVTVTPASITLNRNSGFASNSPFTLAEGSTPQTDAYYALSLSGNTDAIELTITATEGKRFLLFGVNQEGGQLPVLESIEIKGDLTTKTGYKAGDALNLDGLTVEATYSIGGVAQTPVDITDKLGDGLTLTYDPLVENQTEVTITATYGDKSDDITITGLDPVASADPKIYVSTLNVDFGSVEVGEAVPANETVTVTLTNVAAATATLDGEGFSISPSTLTASGDITVSVVASTASAANYSATLTISDDATENPADSKVITLSFAVTEPVVNEEYELVSDVNTLAAGDQIIIVAENAGTYYTLDGSITSQYFPSTAVSISAGIITAPSTSAIILGKDEDNWTMSMGGQLIGATAAKKASLGNNDASNTWTIAIAENVATITNTTTTYGSLQFNYNNGSNSRFLNYTSTQTAVAIYKKVAAPAPEYETVRSGLEINRYYTVCLPKKVTAIKGASFWTLNNKSQDGATAYLEEETNNLPFAAGTPFIIQATAANLEVVYEGAATEDAGTNGALHGTLVYMDADALAAAGSDIYMLFNNELRPVGDDNHLDANRAYVKLSELNPVAEAPQSAPGKRVRAMPMQPQTATGIEDLNASEKPMKMMINGQIFILRGEKMYDTTGRLVK